MTKKGKIIIPISILLTILVAYNICFFVVPINRELSNASLWISYAFTFVFVIAMGFTAFLSFRKKELRSKVLGVPIFYVGFWTAVVQFLLDLIVMVVGNFVSFDWWITVIAETLLSGMMIVLVIARTSYRSAIEANYTRRDDNTAFIFSLRRELKAIWENNVSEIKKPLFRLYETALYTDPVSTSAVISIEDEILDRLNELKKHIRDGNTAKSEIAINDMIRLLRERKSNLR